MKEIIKKMINKIYKKALKEIWENGFITHPRNMECKELLCYKINLKNPNQNIITLPGFETNLNYVKEELNWYLSADRNFNFSSLIKKIWEQYSDDGVTVNSNYGERIFGKHKIINQNQWNQTLEELTNDSDSRRSIINLHSYFDKDNLKSKDVPCTIAIQSLIRDNKLNWIVYMRSNDIYKGFRNDIYCFTELQKKMAKDLNIKLGNYYHIAGSMHLYSTDYNKVKNLLNIKKEEKWI